MLLVEVLCIQLSLARDLSTRAHYMRAREKEKNQEEEWECCLVKVGRRVRAVAEWGQESGQEQLRAERHLVWCSKRLMQNHKRMLLLCFGWESLRRRWCRQVRGGGVVACDAWFRSAC
ncbi:hypothetical protein M758_UG332600 [Ceratodon purpureus]|nr:hypothetical protein M758_UG332600 [Ceratodon purpureus]